MVLAMAPIGLFVLIATGVIHGITADKALVLKPPVGKIGAPVAWIVLPGAEIGMETYQPLAEAVQQRSAAPLWVAVLGTYLTPTPIPPELGPRIDHVLKDMQTAGLDLSTAKLFYGGHSLGSVFIQDHLYAYNGKDGPLGGSIQVVGQVLMGGFIQRKYVYPTWTYPITTLTLGGELDGLARPTRMAEAFFHAKEHSEEFPVIVLPGVTHMQFSSGSPTFLVKLRDLQPEVSHDEAHNSMASAIVAYIEKVVDKSNSAAYALNSLQASTETFLKPIILAYEKEGARWLGSPTQFGGPSQSECVIGKDKGLCPAGSQWAPEAQRVISGGIDGWSLSVTNEFVELSSTPLTGGDFHLPRISNDTKTNTITITTYSQSYWDDAKPSWFAWKDVFDKFDTGFVATSALEIATKLASRQCTLIQGAGKSNTSFDVDGPDFCRQTNEKAYEWALQNAGVATAKRFKESGQKFVFGDDMPKSGGPLWIYARLAFDEMVDQSGEKVIQVSAPMCKTEIDYWTKHFGPIPKPASLPDPGCYHYCKLLSPARAMEWIYVDSLRLKRGLSAVQTNLIV